MFSLSVQINAVTFTSSKLEIACNFTATKGVVHISGRNGAGKTSIIKAIAGIYGFDGDCTINGISIKHLTSHEKKDVSYCPDKYCFSDALTPLEYLKFINSAYGLNSKTLGSYAALLEIYGVDSKFFNTSFNSLSYGTIKKILICACFLSNSKVVLMDEPINGLDQVGKNALSTEIKKLMGDRIIVIVCHDKEWMSQFRPTKIEI